MRRIVAIPAALLSAGALALVGTAPAHAATTETVTDTQAAPIAVDDTTIDRSLTIAAAGPVTSVELALTFEHSRIESCPAPADTGYMYPAETGAVLTSPDGTAVTLIQAVDFTVVPFIEGSYTPSVNGTAQAVTVTFTADATDIVGTTNGGIPESGTFLPASGSMNDFAGLDAAGDWTLTIVDSAGLDATCYIGASLTVEVGAPPALDAATLPAGTVGTAYTAAIPLHADSDPATSFSLASGTLPTGLALDPVTGAITGTPTASGSFTFEVIGHNADGASAPVQYLITIEPAAAPAEDEEEEPTLPATGADSGWLAPTATAAAAATLLGGLLLLLRRRSAA